LLCRRRIIHAGIGRAFDYDSVGPKLDYVARFCGHTSQHGYNRKWWD
jgi:hypothetical protein